MDPIRALASMRTGFGMTTADGRLSYVNDAFAKFFDASADELIGLDLLGKLPGVGGEPPLRDRLASRREGLAEDYEIEVRVRSGRRVSAIVRSTPMFGEGGIFLGSFATLDAIGGAASPSKLAAVGNRAPSLAHAALTAREYEILHDLLEGLGRREIATRRRISLHTVRNHAKAIYRKLGVHSQVELVVKLRD